MLKSEKNHCAHSFSPGKNEVAFYRRVTLFDLDNLSDYTLFYIITALLFGQNCPYPFLGNKKKNSMKVYATSVHHFIYKEKNTYEQISSHVEGTAYKEFVLTNCPN